MSVIACIGAGSIGRSWATLFAAAGCRVRVYDDDASGLRHAQAVVRESLFELQGAGALDDAAGRLAHVQFVGTLAEAVLGAEYVQESIVEELEAKRALFEALDELAPPHVILASSTSEIAGSRFMAGLAGRRRCLVAHPVNPPHLIPLVEICPTPFTDREVVEAARRLMRSVGQEPVLVNREIGGFILNRLQAAVIAEALHLVGEGVCSVEDLDKTITRGLGRRWAFIGPFEAGHLNSDGGYADYIFKFERTLRELVAGLRTDYPWDRDLIARIDTRCRELTAGRSVRELQLERDRKLIALRRHFDSQYPPT